MPSSSLNDVLLAAAAAAMRVCAFGWADLANATAASHQTNEANSILDGCGRVLCGARANKNASGQVYIYG